MKSDKVEASMSWCEVTTCHGVADIARSRARVCKLLWLLVVGVCCTYMLTQLALVINRTIGGEWDTLVYNRAAPPDGLVFPTIVLCNYNRVMASRAQQLRMPDELIAYLFAAVHSTYSVYPRFNTPEADKRFALWRASANLSTYSDILHALSHDCELTMLSLSLNSQLLPDDFCTRHNALVHIEELINHEMGACLYVHVNSTHRQTKAGSHRGVSMLLNVHSSEYLSLLDNNFAEQGFAMQLRYGGYTNRGQWIALQPGLHHYVAMHHHQYNTRRDWFEWAPPACVEQPPTRMIAPEMYSMDMCEYDCELQSAMRFCGCIILEPIKQAGGKAADDYPDCPMEQWMQCQRSQLPQNLREARARCVAQCAILCNFLDISYTTTSSKFPNDKQALQMQTELRRRHNYSVLVSDLLVVDVYFAELETIKHQTSQATTLAALFGDVGGLMGLWAGCSVLTLVQACVYACVHLYDKVMQQMRVTTTVAS